MSGKVACPECGGPCNRGYARCGECRRQFVAAAAAARRMCSGCGGPTRKPNALSCETCRRKAERDRAWSACQDCGVPVRATRQRCRPCWRTAMAGDGDVHGLLPRFNAAAFRELLARDDMEWTPEMLAVESGVAARTIYTWRSGTKRPRVVEWRMVAAVLALDTCRHCGGSGTVDPTAESLAAMTQAVERQAVGLPTPEPLIEGAGWTLDRNALTLTVNGVEFQTTQREAQVIAVLAAAGGRHISAVQLGVKLGVANHAIHTYLARLRGKCSVVGVDIGRVVQNGHGAGYRAVLTRREEVAS